MNEDINTINIEDILRAILNNTLKEIMAVINAESGSIFLFDSQSKELVLDSFYNAADLYLGSLRQKIGEGISGRVAQTKERVLVKDINQDFRFRRNGFNHYRTNSFISIPLFASERLLGVLNFGDKSSGEPFSDKDLEFAATISRYTCLVIEGFNNCIETQHTIETLDKQKALLEKYASVGKLAAGIVHEINNPLDGAIRYSNILLNKAENNSILREYLLELKKGLNRIANITKSLVDFSRQVNSNYSGSQGCLKYVDVHGLIDESLDALSNNLDMDGKIRVNKRYKDNLPEILDFGVLYMVINIIRNAFDAMPCGGTLDIFTDIKDSMLEVGFKDTGSGISSEVRERIFEPFFTTKARDKGRAGLGLAICNEIINKYEGRIEVKSSIGQGSTFKVLIPKKYFKNAQVKL